jgi:hypothetical protein
MMEQQHTTVALEETAVLSTYFLSLMSFHHDGNFFGRFQQRMG